MFLCVVYIISMSLVGVIYVDVWLWGLLGGGSLGYWFMVFGWLLEEGGVWFLYFLRFLNRE